MKWTFPFLFLLPTICFAKSDSLNRDGQLLLKWNPFTLFDYPSIQFGAEYFYKPDWSIHGEVGIILPLFEKAAISPENIHGYRIKLHPRYYFGKFFIGPELHVVNVNYISSELFATQFVTDSFGVRTPVDDTAYNIGVRKNAVCFNLVGGVQFFKQRKTGVEFFGGFGVRYVNTIFSNTPSGKEYVPTYSHILVLENKEKGKRTLFNAVLGIRILFKIRK